MAKDKKTKSNAVPTLMKLLFFASFIGLGIFIGADINYHLGENATDVEYYLRAALYLLVICAVYLLHIIVHEGGHLVFGLLSGYRFSSFRIGNVIITKEGGKLKFSRYALAGTAGQCLLSPPEEKDGKIPVMLYNLGGVLFNVLLAAVSLALYIAFPRVPLLSAMLMMSVIIGFVTAAMNGVPMQMGIVNNDGYNAVSLGGDVHAMRAFANQLSINGRMTLGERLRDMPQELFELPDGADMRNPIINTITVFKCNRLMDENRFSEVRELAARLIADENVIGIYKNILTCDLAFCEMLAGETDTAKSRFTKEQKKFMAAMRSNPGVIRTEYAFALLCEKDTAKAEKCLADFEKAAKKHPYKGDAESERGIIAAAKRVVSV